MKNTIQRQVGVVISSQGLQQHNNININFISINITVNKMMSLICNDVFPVVKSVKKKSTFPLKCSCITFLGHRLTYLLKISNGTN